MKNNLIPLKNVGDFKLNDEISNYIDKYKFKYTPKDKITGWEIYSLEDIGIELYVENDKIISILCFKECYYKSKNIIGLNIEEFINLIDKKPNNDIDNLYVNEFETQDVYEFEDIGLQVWCKNNIIDSVIVSSN